jgi:uncharacterized protein YndB with AHSA1/START domain
MIFGKLFGRKDSATADVGGTKDLLTLSRKVDVPPERAFAVFVDEIGRWWPRDYTWGKERLETMQIEPRYGGKCVEITKDGARSVWGTVLAFDRPNHIVFAWQIKADRTPEESEGTASRVDVRFTDAGDGKTSVLLVHRDFFRHGEGYEEYRNQMAAAKGWPLIMDAYAKAAAG